MNSITMLQTASIVLLLTAAGGLLMAIQRVAQKSNPPSWLAMTHGFLAASGLTLLTYAGLTAASQAPLWWGSRYWRSQLPEA
jgi:hypothetical protein